MRSKASRKTLSQILTFFGLTLSANKETEIGPLGLHLVLAEAWSELAKQTRLSAPPLQFFTSKICRRHLWLELRGERDSGERQCMEP